MTAPGDLVTRERRGRGNVERRETTVHRNAHEDVATITRQARETLAFGSEHENDRLVGQVEVEEAAIASFVEPYRPASGSRRELEGRGDSAVQRHPQLAETSRPGPA